MAYFHRVIFLALMLLAAWLPTTSEATIPAGTQFRSCMNYYTYCGYGGTASASQDAEVFVFNSTHSPSTWYVQSRTSTSFVLANTSNGTVYTGGTDTVSSCPANSTASGGSCTCTSPYIENSTHTACVSVQQAACSFLKGQTTYVSGLGSLSPGQTLCGDAGCNVTMSSTVIQFVDKTTGGSVGQGDATITDTPCTYTAPAPGAVVPATTPATVATPSTCPGGSVGSVNGVQVCVSYDSNKNTVKAVSGTTSSDTATGPAGAASSTTSTSTSVKCEGTQCTTSTTTTKTPGDGTAATVTTADKTTSKDQLCVTDPANPICKKDISAFSGTCGSVPACSGDAIQCAIAAQQLKTACAFENTAAATSEEGVYAAGKLVTGDQTVGLAGNTTTNFSGSSFDQTEFLGAAAGMSDLTVTVFRSTVTLPFSSINIWLERLGVIMQAVTFLLCIRIVSRG